MSIGPQYFKASFQGIAAKYIFPQNLQSIFHFMTWYSASEKKKTQNSS